MATVLIGMIAKKKVPTYSNSLDRVAKVSRRYQNGCATRGRSNSNYKGVE